MTKKLIIIDDSLLQLNVLKTFFSNNGWEALGVQNAKIGYEMIFDFAPDLIITDAIMPVMGASSLIKSIRQNEKISKIPIIVYSVLDEINAKFYVKEELNEYFLKKSEKHNELLDLANLIVEKYPLDEEYKNEILKIGIQNYETKQQNELQSEQQNEQNDDDVSKNANINKFDKKEYETEIKILLNSQNNENKIIPELFLILYPKFNYNLCLISLFSFENNERTTYFDIKDIILSPKFKDDVLEKHKSALSVMYKKYAPNLKTIVNENEFLSKIEFSIECRDKNIVNIGFYSCENLKWNDETLIETTKDLLENFFKTYFNKKSSSKSLKDDIGNRYFPFLNNKFENIKNSSNNAYFTIIQISNYQELSLNLHHEDMDLINSMISKKIVDCLEDNEQIYRSDIDEYSVVIFAKNDKQAQNRLNYIVNNIDKMVYEEEKVEILIGASPCIFDNNFDLAQAQKMARIALDEAEVDKVVLKNG